MSLIRVRGKGQITLPDDIRRAVRLDEGTYLEASVDGEAIILRPKLVIDASQAWFWTDAWQAGERAASADIAAGRVSEPVPGDAFRDSLG